MPSRCTYIVASPPALNPALTPAPTPQPHARTQALAHTCNSTWPSSTAITSLQADVNQLTSQNRIMGDIITSMVGIIDGMQTVQAQLTTGLAQLASSTSQTSSQVYNQINTGSWNTPPLPPHNSAVCSNWNETLQSWGLLFFTVKDVSLRSPASTNCSDAVANAFIAQVSWLSHMPAASSWVGRGYVR